MELSQVEPSGQALPQEPQLCESLEMLMHCWSQQAPTPPSPIRQNTSLPRPWQPCTSQELPLQANPAGHEAVLLQPAGETQPTNGLPPLQVAPTGQAL